jgi:hypothetical protein
MAKARYAIVRDGVVWSVTEWDQEKSPNWAPPFGELVACGNSVAAGDTYDGGTFTRQVVPVPVPQAVTKLQLFTALTKMGLWSTFWTALNANPEAKFVWDLATDVNRSHELVSAFQQALGKTDQQIDAIFRLAIEP